MSQNTVLCTRLTAARDRRQLHNRQPASTQRTAPALWEAVKLVLEQETDPQAYHAHVAIAAPAGMVGNTFTIAAPGPYWPTKMADRVRSLLTCMYGKPIVLKIQSVAAAVAKVSTSAACAP